MIWPIGTKFIVRIDGDERMWILGEARSKTQTGIDPTSELGHRLREIRIKETVAYTDSTKKRKFARIIQIITPDGKIRKEVKPEPKQAKKASTQPQPSTSTSKKGKSGRPAATGKGSSPHAHYTNHCWNCKSGIDSARAAKCQVCGWYVCRYCGACGCGYQA